MNSVRLFIPVICYNHTCHTAYMFSLLKLIMTLRDLKIYASIFPIGFESLVNRARNAAVAYFMTSDCTHILFLDSDIEFKVEDILKLITAKEQIVGGAYSQKWLNMQKIQQVFSQSPLPEQPMHLCTNHSIHTTQQDMKDKIEVDYLTTGCMLIERSVIETMIQTYPERKYKNDIDGYMGANQEMFYNFFGVEIHPDTKRYESEDYCFCRLWKAQGGKVYVVPDIDLTHYGWYGYGMNMKKQWEYSSK